MRGWLDTEGELDGEENEEIGSAEVNGEGMEESQDIADGDGVGENVETAESAGNSENSRTVELAADLEDGGSFNDGEDRLYGYDEDDADSIELASPESTNGHLLCDQYRQCVSQKSTSDYVYCFGYEACDGMVVEADGVSESEVQCYAADSCQNADIGGVRSVQCNAKWSCRDAKKVSTQSTNPLQAI